VACCVPIAAQLKFGTGNCEHQPDEKLSNWRLLRSRSQFASFFPAGNIVWLQYRPNFGQRKAIFIRKL
jgi:hypothetical protein